ncbi:MAG: Asp-tRNA(Asn)/Glu-tRNA(Gln) amidotransferase subunit GatA [Patescibacteria group bacterium]
MMPFNMDTKTLDIHKIKAGYEAGEFTAVEVTEAYLKAIEAKNKEFNIYLEVFATEALEQAKASDKRRQEDKVKGPLDGVPMAIKDNMLIKDHLVSSASKMLENYRAPYDASVISKLREAGVIFLGRTNMDEFAMGGSTENSAFGPTINPLSPGLVPGGSSGGSAAAVAAGWAAAALGSDTGGSIRQPAAFCGVVGYKPSYGAVSRYGLMAMASSLDQIGPITKNVADANLVYDVIAGYDNLDTTSRSKWPTVSPLKDKPTVAIPKNLLTEGLAPEILSTIEETEKKLIAAGWQVKEVSMPNLQYALNAYYIIMPAEVSSNLARFDGLRYGYRGRVEDNLMEWYKEVRGEGFGSEVRRRIILGTYVLSAGHYDAYYGRARSLRREIIKEYDQVFAQGPEAVLMPTTPIPAFAQGERMDDPLQMYLADIFTVPANLAGLPAMAVPAGLDDKGRALSVQLIGQSGGDKQLLTLADRLEKI